MDSTYNHDAFRNVCNLCYDTLQAVPAIKHVSRAKLHQTALDISIVALGVRSGYLFDAFALRDSRLALKDILVDFLIRLRQKSDIFKDMSILYDYTSDQLFFVHLSSLRTYWDSNEATLSGALLSWVTFVNIDGSHTEVSVPPPGVQARMRSILLSDLQPNTPVLVSLPEDCADRAGDIVAFAACILEFPVAYVPDFADASTFLAGVPLDVYECVLVQDAPTLTQREHSLLKFSCPQTLGNEVSELCPENMLERLRARFAGRLDRAGFPGQFNVRHSVETMDRVAL